MLGASDRPGCASVRGVGGLWGERVTCDFKRATPHHILTFHPVAPENPLSGSYDVAMPSPR